jgi:4-hydroxy-tetrahydrodipicolinate reductase
MERTRVVIHGALGKMGQEITRAVLREPGLKIVGAVEKKVTQKYLPLTEPLTGASELVPFSSDLDSLVKSCSPDVLVDFTNAEASIAAARTTIKQKVRMVIGTTGLSEENLTEIEQLCRANEIGAVVAPNFSLGAVLLMQLARVAAKFFDYAEIIEMHHEKKIDAPSGTAVATAKAMLEAHGKPFAYPKTEEETVSSVRGGKIGGIAIHSLRSPGFMAGQEVIFSGAGQTLSLRCETISRESYIPGVILAIKEVTKHKGLIYGLDALLKL